MLLRRVTEHVKSQNWVAVGLDIQSDRQALGIHRGALPVYDPNLELRQRIEYDFELLASDPLFMSLAVSQLRDQKRFHRYRRQLLECAEAMLSQLEGTLRQ